MAVESMKTGPLSRKKVNRKWGNERLKEKPDACKAGQGSGAVSTTTAYDDGERRQRWTTDDKCGGREALGGESATRRLPGQFETDGMF